MTDMKAYKKIQRELIKEHIVGAGFEKLSTTTYIRHSGLQFHLINFQKSAVFNHTYINLGVQYDFVPNFFEPDGPDNRLTDPCECMLRCRTSNVIDYGLPLPEFGPAVEASLLEAQKLFDGIATHLEDPQAFLDLDLLPKKKLIREMLDQNRRDEISRELRDSLSTDGFDMGGDICFLLSRVADRRGLEGLAREYFREGFRSAARTGSTEDWKHWREVYYPELES